MGKSTFRQVTQQAVLEIIKRWSYEGKFGLVMTLNNVQEACDEIAALMEVAINLRREHASINEDVSSSAQTISAPQHGKLPALMGHSNTGKVGYKQFFKTK